MDCFHLFLPPTLGVLLDLVREDPTMRTVVAVAVVLVASALVTQAHGAGQPENIGGGLEEVTETFVPASLFNLIRRLSRSLVIYSAKFHNMPCILTHDAPGRV